MSESNRTLRRVCFGLLAFALFVGCDESPRAGSDPATKPAASGSTFKPGEWEEMTRQAEADRARRRASTAELDFDRLTPTSEGQIGDGFIVIERRGGTVIASRDSLFIEVRELPAPPVAGQPLIILEALQVMNPKAERRLANGTPVTVAVLSPIPRAG